MPRPSFIVKGFVEGLGMRFLLFDVGVCNVEVLSHCGAGAALSVVERKGVGRMRRINTNILWLQEKRFEEQVTCLEVWRQQNPADI